MQFSDHTAHVYNVGVSTTKSKSELRVTTLPRYHDTTHVEWVRATSTNATPPQNIVEGQDHTLHDPPFALS